MKGSIYSQVQGKFVPFVLFGVLVPRDADILLNMNQLNLLRYRGNVSPEIEYLYLIEQIKDQIATDKSSNFNDEFEQRVSILHP